MEPIIATLKRISRKQADIEAHCKENGGLEGKMALLQIKLDQMLEELEEFDRAVLEGSAELTQEERERLAEYYRVDQIIKRATFIGTFLA